MATNARYVSPPLGVHPPSRWGTDGRLEQLLGQDATLLTKERRAAYQYYRCGDHALELFLTYFSPAIRASEQAEWEHLRKEPRSVFSRYNQATDGTAVAENTYLLTEAVRS